MKIAFFLIFISIVLFIYGTVNYYLFRRGLQTIPQDSVLRTYYTALFIFLASSFWIGRISENFIDSVIIEALIWIGSFWLAFMLYFTLFALLFDLLRFIDLLTGFIPNFITGNYNRVKFYFLIGTLIISSMTVAYGHFNSKNIKVTELELVIPKRMGEIDSLNVVAVSDIHLGTIIGKSRIENVVSKINSLNPDIVLLPGDIIDEDLKPVLKYNIGGCLLNIRSKFGVYAVTGNHEYIGGVQPAVKYLEEHGVTLLRDEYKLINNSFYLIGREDKSITQFSGSKRKELNEIVLGMSKNYPSILLDHQPYDLHLAAENGIDLQLSGHTHHGQLWPLNYITGMIYELSWGYLKKDNTHYYVSSGVGGWGPPVRTGSYSEIVNIKIKFE